MNSDMQPHTSSATHHTDCCRQSLKQRSKRKGFALIIALSLMGFIVLLMLSLGSMVAVESQSATQSLGLLKARQNAELGALVALGNLQKLAGPDQRVTARSDILDVPLASPIAGQAQWTGVWSSKEDTGDGDDSVVGLDGRNVQWLVSGNNPNARVQIDEADAVDLAGTGSAVANANERVAVLKESVLTPARAPAGDFAYWVSDEGVKARLNLGDPYLTTTDNDEEYYRHAIPQQADASAVLDSQGNRPYSAGSGISIWKDESTNPQRIASVGMLPILQPSADSDDLQREFFHDFSTNSRSVLVNTKDGGLKRDLSTILLGLPSDLQGPIFPPAELNDDGSLKRGDPGGPKWEQLADYYEYAREDKGATVDMRKPTEDDIGIAPVVTRFNFIVQAFANQISIPTNPGQPKATDYEYTVGMFPLITLWNPYDKDMVIPDLGLELDMRGVFLYDKPNGNDRTNILTLLSGSQFEHPAGQNRSMVRFTIAGTTIPAGRAINFSPPVNSYHAFKQPELNLLKVGASADLIRGFFTRPKRIAAGTTTATATAADVDFIDVSMAGTSPHVWQQVTNLYSDTEFDEVDRFIALMTYGMGDIDRNHPWHSRRVIKVSDIDESDFSFILPEGETAASSLDVDPEDLISPVDVNDIHSYARGITGSTLIMNLPKLDRHDGLQAIHLLSQMNPRSPIAYDQIHVRLMPDWKNFGYRLYDSGKLSWWEGNTAVNYLDGVDNTFSYIGLSNSDKGDGSDRMILFEIPENPPLGIGQFMHANLMNVDAIANNFNDRFWGNNIQQSHTAPSYAIGNSFANIHLPLGTTKLNFDQSNASDAFDGFYNNRNLDWKGAHYDYSYELNDMLWDNFFMSTILPNNRSGGTVSFPLPNARMTAAYDNVSDTDLLSEERAASQLMLDGGFNINSTSVAAWESVLGALRDVDTLGEDPSTDTLVHNFSRFVEPELQSVSENPSYGSENDRIVSGFRNLSDSQISVLATNIVDEIRTRRSVKGYPFLSLSEFINRSIDAEDINSDVRKRFAYQGALQQAIDQAAINGTPAFNVNGDSQTGNGLWDDNYSSEDIPSNIAPYLSDSVAAVENRPLAEGTPGFLTQADLLSKLGSIITPRSDTFVIRSYGDYNDPFSGDTLGEAYCEMVVQRKPDYLNSTDEPHDDPSVHDNVRFGRRFEVVSFRWLEGSEI
ncbi:hypothetical protein [Rubellicoccus peritrichatus]|uniref:Verru_Chthon cassette protein A n=1 Tax=Rubellicoccus peritrichatus TaxID=3080537 RepID=A0AAQ3QVG4_9BACT|nr:hypothetical protein [Puniceicoccus sp. CR14]WOO40860.1 hypothetical protein RZN69_19730 [Puniceicoccus sp. CR14]